MSIGAGATRFWTKLPSFSRVVALLCLLCFTAIIYSPGLDSRFILDDSPTLSGLDNVKTYGVMQYVLDGVTGPSGRPVASFTFALQHQQWPDNPFYFKLVNLFIHLLNACLVYFLAHLIFKKIRPENKNTVEINAGGIKQGELAQGTSTQAHLFALIVTALWLLHPLQSTTVLYVVQRMTQLSALFTLLGLSGYLIYREIYASGKVRKGLIGMSLSVSVATLLAILAKENGILLPLYVLVTELTIYGTSSRSKMFKQWCGLFLILPLLLLLAYLAVRFESNLDSYQFRPYSMAERLLTQPVVLVHYLSDILFPHFKVFTLYHDDFPVSRGLLDPPLTAISMFVCGGLIIIGIYKIKIWPVICFGILWFFAGHALEASHINLELYFDHRNYLPLLGVIVLIVWLMFRLAQIFDKRIISSVFVIYFLLLALTTLIEVKAWADPLGQAVKWEKDHPESIRTLQNLVNMNLRYGHFEEAKEVQGRLAERLPGDASLFLKDILISYCIEKTPLSDQIWTEMLSRAQVATRSGIMAIMETNNLLTNIEQGNCLKSHIPRVALLIVVLAHNREFSVFKAQLHQIAAFMLVQVADVEAALANIDVALSLRKTPTRFALKFQLLMVKQEWAEAEKVLVEFAEYLKHNKKKYITYKKILDDMDRELGNHVKKLD